MYTARAQLIIWTVSMFSSGFSLLLIVTEFLVLAMNEFWIRLDYKVTLESIQTPLLFAQCCYTFNLK